MMVDTRVYGYVFDGYVLGADCLLDEPGIESKSGAYVDEHGTQGTGVFSHMDDGYGLMCDRCGEYIFDVWPEVAHTEYGDHDDLSPEDAREMDCDHCRDYLQDHDAHANDAYNLGEERFEDDCDECATLVVDNDNEHNAGKHSATPATSCQWCRPRLAQSAGQERMGL